MTQFINGSEFARAFVKNHRELVTSGMILQAMNELNISWEPLFLNLIPWRCRFIGFGFRVSVGGREKEVTVCLFALKLWLACGPDDDDDDDDDDD
jgi:hypothetical protein